MARNHGRKKTAPSAVGPDKALYDNLLKPQFSGKTMAAYEAPKSLVDALAQNGQGRRGLAMALHSESTVHISGPNVDKLLIAYNRALVDNGFALSRRDLRKKDMVDARGLFSMDGLQPWQAPAPDLTIDDKAYMITEYWYSFVPCLDEGVLHVNTGRYIYWRVTEVDLTANRLVLYLHDYVYYDETGWQPGVSGTIAWRFNDPETEKTDALKNGSRLMAEYAIIDGEPNYDAIYSMLDPKSVLGWNQREIDDWNDTILEFARRTGRELWKKTHKTNLDNLAGLFTSYMAKINRTLETNKIKSSLPVKPEHATDAPKPSQADGRTKPAGRRIRVIGDITVTSVARPRAGRKNVAANYKIPAWTARGHLRTLKNGKKVYVRQSVHHRKCLRQPDAQPTKTPLTIKFKKPESEE